MKLNIDITDSAPHIDVIVESPILPIPGQNIMFERRIVVVLGDQVLDLDIDRLGFDPFLVTINRYSIGRLVSIVPQPAGKKSITVVRPPRSAYNIVNEIWLDGELSTVSGSAEELGRRLYPLIKKMIRKKWELW